MLTFHQETGADVTVAARPVPRRGGHAVRRAGGRRRRARGGLRREAGAAQGHAGRPRAVAGVDGQLPLLAPARSSTRCWPTPAARTDHDFGRSIIPELVPTGRVFAYDFQDNEVPGVKPYEEQGYWRDVGTVQAYWDAHMDLLGRVAALRPRQPATGRSARASTRARPPASSGATSTTLTSASPRWSSGPPSATRSSAARCGSTRARSSRTRSSWTTPRSARAPACGGRSSIASTSSRPTARSAWTRPSTGGGTTSTPRASSWCPRGGRREFLLGLEEF